MSALKELYSDKRDILSELKNPEFSAATKAAMKKSLSKINVEILSLEKGNGRVFANAKIAKGAVMEKRKEKKANTEKKSAGATAPKTSYLTFRKTGMSKKAIAAATKRAEAAAKKTPKSKAAPKAKTPKVVKTKATKPEYAGNYVENIDTEKKLLGRVLALNGKTTTKAELEKILRAFNIAKTNRTIRKDSVDAGILEKIYNLVLTTNSSLRRPDAKTPQINFKPETLAALQNVVHQDAVYPSILLLRKYVNYQGKKPTKKVLDAWFKAATKIKSTDKYHAKIQEAMRIIRIYEAGKSPNVFIPKTQLNGLAGLLGYDDSDYENDYDNDYDDYNGVGQIKTKKSIGKTSQLNGLDCPCDDKKNELPEVVCSTDLDSLNTGNRLDFNTYWESLLGNPSDSFKAAFVAKAGDGKTTLALNFCKYFAANFGKCLYVSKEEYGSRVLNDNAKRLQAVSKNLFIAGDANILYDKNELLNTIQCQNIDLIVIDSVTDAEIGIGEVHELVDLYPNSAFIFIIRKSQHGGYIGKTPNKIVGFVDIVVEFDGQGNASWDKNRCLRDVNLPNSVQIENYLSKAKIAENNLI